MKRAIIIGATSGIGNELSKILVDNQYKVGITGRRKIELEKLKESNPKNFSINSFDCTTLVHDKNYLFLNQSRTGSFIARPVRF